MNKTTAIAIVVALIVGIIMGSQIGCGHGGKAKYTSDTTYIKRTDTAYHTIKLPNNVPYTIWGKSDTVYIPTIIKINGHDTTIQRIYTDRTDTAAYADTIRQNNEFKAEIFDTLAGNRIIGRSLRWANLTPQEVITKTKKEPLVKVYIGAEARVPVSDIRISRFDFVPGLAVEIKDKYLLNADYGLFGQQISAGLKIKISFHKQ